MEDCNSKQTLHLHEAGYDSLLILARDNNQSRLYTIEALLIRDLKAYLTDSVELKLWYCLLWSRSLCSPTCYLACCM